MFDSSSFVMLFLYRGKWIKKKKKKINTIKIEALADKLMLLVVKKGRKIEKRRDCRL